MCTCMFVQVCASVLFQTTTSVETLGAPVMLLTWGKRGVEPWNRSVIRASSEWKERDAKTCIWVSGQRGDSLLPQRVWDSLEGMATQLLSREVSCPLSQRAWCWLENVLWGDRRLQYSYSFGRSLNFCMGAIPYWSLASLFSSFKQKSLISLVFW